MQAFMNAISPGYLQTMGVPLLEGRDFDRREGTHPKAAIVNRKFAHTSSATRAPSAVTSASAAVPSRNWISRSSA